MENRPHPAFAQKRLIYRDGQNPLKKVQPALPPPRKNWKKPLHNGFPYSQKQENMPSM